MRCVFLVSALWTTSAAGRLVFDVAEESPVGTVVGVVSGDTSRPVASQLRYRIRSSSSSSTGRYFELDEVTGLLRTAELLDREDLCPYEPLCQLVLDVIGKYFHCA